VRGGRGPGESAHGESCASRAAFAAQKGWRKEWADGRSGLIENRAQCALQMFVVKS